jgi:hypothetical protein
MSDRAGQDRKSFSVEQANALLPLVRAITADIVALSGDLVDRRHRLNLLRSDRPSDARDVYSEELAQVDRDLEADRRRLCEYAAELRDLGVELKDAVGGLVDFPTMMDGRPAYLCWKLGEVDVAHWHECDAGFAGRKPLAPIEVG